MGCLALLVAVFCCVLEGSSVPLSFLETSAELRADSPCSDSSVVSKGVCLDKPAKCMWMSFENGNRLCLPCQWGDIEVPCAAPGVVWPEGQVSACETACANKNVLTKSSPCTDISGDITKDSCFAKGESADIKCMWTAYKTGNGMKKSICGPCQVKGIGTVPPYMPTNPGPEPRSRVYASASMCTKTETEDGIPCEPKTKGSMGIPAVTMCRPTPKPNNLEVLPLTALGLKTVEGAPPMVAVIVPAPYGEQEFEVASSFAARAAGWPVGTKLPPDAAVSVYRGPPLGAPRIPASMKIKLVLPPPGVLGLEPAPTTLPPAMAIGQSFLQLHAWGAAHGAITTPEVALDHEAVVVVVGPSVQSYAGKNAAARNSGKKRLRLRQRS